MELNELQKRALKYDLGKNEGRVMSAAFLEKAFGLAGEAGEVMEKLKKIIRDDGGNLSDETKLGVVKELGDTLWYVAVLAEYLGVELQTVAEINLKKLESRYNRGKLTGSGDER